jgi:hypothetical protein
MKRPATPPPNASDGPYADLTRSGTQADPKAKGVPFWGDEAGSWDAVWLKGIRLPGIAEVDGRGFSRRVDKKRSAGRNGATVTHMGLEPADIDITLTLWTPQHLTELQEVLKSIRPAKASAATAPNPDKLSAQAEGSDKFSRWSVIGGGLEPYSVGAAPWETAKPFSPLMDQSAAAKKKGAENLAVAIYHPALALYGIGKVVIVSASFPEGSKEGRFKVKIKCVEWVSGAKAKGTVATPAQASRVDLTEAGPGAVARRVDGKRTPAEDNTGPE